MSQASKKEYLQRIYPRYEKAEGKEKRRILDEFCANCGYHRKHAIRLLKGPPPGEKPQRKRRPRKVTYGPRVISILKAVWKAADYPWSVRLKALLPKWLPWIRQRFRLRVELERQLLAISARSIDYRRRAHKGKLRRRRWRPAASDQNGTRPPPQRGQGPAPRSGPGMIAHSTGGELPRGSGAPKNSRPPGCGNDAPRKAWKTPRTSFPRFPLRLEIRQRTPSR
jgi:hypothetical protein